MAICPNANTKKLLMLGAVLATYFILSPHRIYAATLSGTSDYIPDDTPSTTNVTHNVGFVIPLSGHDIVPSDYIRIVMTNFSAVTAPTSGSGWTGSPTYGVTGNVAYVTNVSAPAGSGIGISGMTATNPADPGDFDVTIQIANDMVGSIIYDSATVTAQENQGITTTTVTVSSANSSIELFGFTSPSAFVTILLNGGVAGTTVATGGGDFHKQLTGLEQETSYNVSIYAQDTMLRQTQTVSFVVYTLPYTNHVISNIVLPTSIEISATEITLGDILDVFGRAHPLSQITVFVGAGGMYSDTVQANSNGWWTYPFDSEEHTLGDGVHIAYAREVVQGGFTSILTQSIQFVVSACQIADLNCDGRVNLTDFSILMYYWLDTSPANPRADINEDSIVNLKDFSIMMYYWTG